MRLTVILTWWFGWRPVYQVAYVNAMCRMLREYLRIPFRIVLLTDQDAQGAEVDEIGPLPDEPRGLRIVRPVNCFRRLRFFDPDYNGQFGSEWIMSIDLDTLIRSDITDLIEPALDHPFGLWILKGRHADRTPGERPYNGALYMIRCGAHADVWTSFHPVESPRLIADKQWIGSDQSWIGMAAPGAPTFGPAQGVYFFGQYLQVRRNPDHVPARILNYAGHHKPWSKTVRQQARDIWNEYRRWL